MIYHHVFRVPAALEKVTEFHRQSSNMAAITPPPMVVRMHQAPQVLAQDDTIHFTMWLGPLPVPWLIKIVSSTPCGFHDRQLRGPFAQWDHFHTFKPVDTSTTEVWDEISVRLRPHLLWGPVGLAMFLGLPILFAYRAWKTRRLLR